MLQSLSLELQLQQPMQVDYVFSSSDTTIMHFTITDLVPVDLSCIFQLSAAALAACQHALPHISAGCGFSVQTGTWP